MVITPEDQRNNVKEVSCSCSRSRGVPEVLYYDCGTVIAKH
jgi:hypothetical protein